MNENPGCIIIHRDDGTMLALDTQGDLVRAFVPSNRHVATANITCEHIVNRWLHSGDFEVIKLLDEGEEE